MNIIDAKGLNCPMPVILAKKQLDSGDQHFTIVVDNQIAVQNLTRLAEGQGATVTVKQVDALFEVELQKGEGAILTTQTAPQSLAEVPAEWVLFVGRNVLGEGDPALGASLIKMFFYTLLQSGDLPAKIMLVNNGVKLATIDEQVVEHLKEIEAKGTQIMVCGACLNFYGLAEQLKAGGVSNMYDILSSMQASPKVITL